MVETVDTARCHIGRQLSEEPDFLPVFLKRLFRTDQSIRIRIIEGIKGLRDFRKKCLGSVFIFGDIA
jgi:hypothetical protein